MRGTRPRRLRQRGRVPSTHSSTTPTPTSASASDGAGSWDADPAKRKLLPGNFPAEAYDNYMRQGALSTDKAVIDAYVALVDKVCPCVLLLHSQGGCSAVAEQRPDKIKAAIAVEPASAGHLDKAAASRIRRS